jgi:hypothetical protein
VYTCVVVLDEELLFMTAADVRSGCDKEFVLTAACVVGRTKISFF